MQPAQLWQHFQSTFAKAIRSVDSQRLWDAWSSSRARTRFYGELLGEVARNLGLKLEPEFMRIDYAFLDAENRPEILVESENNPATAVKELRNLSCVNSPLSILITVAEWSFWADRGKPQEAYFMEKWLTAARPMLERRGETGLLGLIVGELGGDGRLRFYSRILDEHSKPDAGELTLVCRDLRAQRDRSAL